MLIILSRKLSWGWWLMLAIPALKRILVSSVSLDYIATSRPSWAT